MPRLMLTMLSVTLLSLAVACDKRAESPSAPAADGTQQWPPVEERPEARARASVRW
jgi:hypothetical protein